MKRLISVLLCVLLVFGCAAVTSAEDAPSDKREALTDEDFLSVKGRRIYNRRGEEVVLKGVNIGAWLVWEDWLTPVQGADDVWSYYEKLIGRFGTETAYDLIHTYEDNFFTEYDLDVIAEMGFNCIRVPFWYRNFYVDDNGAKLLDANGEWDFSRLDWVVEEAGKRGLYVILDMHGSPGFQSDSPHSGKGKSCGLYEQTDEGEFYRKLTDELWTAIAERFKDDPAVAMYDLLNEPMCDTPTTEIERRVKNEYIYSRLYKTVRAADPDHIITLECIWTGFALPKAFLKGWKNVVYQVHFYNNSDFIFRFFVLLTRILHPTVPLMMGEFYPHEKTTWAGCFKAMKDYNYSWMLWTYKAAGHGMWESDWCLKGSKDGFWRADANEDSAEDIAYKFGDMLRTENGYQDTGHYEKNVKPYVAAVQ